MVNWEGVSSRATIVDWAVKRMIAFIVLFFLVVLTLPSFLENFSFSLTVWIFLGIYILYIIYSTFLLNTYKYTITDENVSFKGGILTRILKNVPYHKITDVTKSQTIIQRIFGIYDIHIQTAGSNFAEISFYGLKDPDKSMDLIRMKLHKNL